MTMIETTWKNWTKTKRISWCRDSLNNEQQPSKLEQHDVTRWDNLRTCEGLSENVVLIAISKGWSAYFPSENCAMTVGLPVWLDKPAETTSQNQSWSSALDPFRRTSWVRSCGQDPLGQLGQRPRHTHFNTHIVFLGIFINFLFLRSLNYWRAMTHNFRTARHTLPPTGFNWDSHCGFQSWQHPCLG